MEAIRAIFDGLDPRDQNARHDFSEMLFISIAAMLCGAKNCSDIWRFAYEKEEMLREVLTLAHGIPSHDTFSALFRKLVPTEFAEAFARFMGRVAAAAGSNRQIALDGKAMRGAFESGRPFAPRMMVSAWGTELRMTLAALPAEGGNEARAAIDVLRLIDLRGAVVTADALHCSARTAEEITRGGGDYVLALKGNQGPLLAPPSGSSPASRRRSRRPPPPRRRATVAGSGARRGWCLRPSSAASTASRASRRSPKSSARG
jgi:hypothetical protein